MWLSSGLAPLIIGLLIVSTVAGDRATTPLASGSQARTVKVSTRATGGLAPWLYMPSIFRGKVLHWSERSYYFEEGIADPSNGKVLLGDHWMALNAQGLPTAYYERYTYVPSGQLHQETYQNATMSVIVRGADYLRPNELVPPGWCVTPMQTNASDLLSDYPQIANTKSIVQLLAVHDAGVQSLTLIPPTTGSLPGVVPSVREGNVATAVVWESTNTDPADGSKSTFQVSLGPLGRVVAQSSKVVNADGSIAMDAWAVYGPLDVYTAAQVPSSIYTVPQDLAKECHA